MALLRFLFIIISVLWLLKMVVRLLLPMLFNSMVNKAQQQSNQRFHQQQQNRPDGRIRVDYIPPREKNTQTDKAGDFVDYEEVKNS